VPGTPLFRLVDIDSLRLRLGVSQADVARLGPGARVRVSVDALGGRSFEGRIRSICPEADEATRTFAVEVVLANPEGRPLKDGFVVRAALVLDRREEALAVPREAVLRRGEESYVFVADDSVAVKRAVQVGPMVGDLHRIDDGLRPGERVVVVGMQNLKDQSPLRVEAVRD